MLSKLALRHLSSTSVFWSRPVMAACAPSAMKSRAVTRPMPLLPPVGLMTVIDGGCKNNYALSRTFKRSATQIHPISPRCSRCSRSRRRAPGHFLSANPVAAFSRPSFPRSPMRGISVGLSGALCCAKDASITSGHASRTQGQRRFAVVFIIGIGAAISLVITVG